MLGVDHHGDAVRTEIVPDASGDLGGQALLHLQSPRIAVQYARELGDADDAVAGKVGDRRLSGDRRHMMLAMRLERDVAQQDDLVIAADLCKGARQVHRRILVITLAIIPPGTCDALRCVEQAFALRVLADPAEQRLDRRENLGGYRAVNGGTGRGHVKHGPGLLTAKGWRSGRGGEGGGPSDRRMPERSMASQHVPWGRSSVGSALGARTSGEPGMQKCPSLA